MNVNDFDKYISAYIDGDLRPSEMKEFEELLNNNSVCDKKFKDFQKMLSELSNLESLKTSPDFLEKLHRKINEPKRVTIINKIQNMNLFGYDYISIGGIAAALTLFIFSVSIFLQSDSIPIVDLEQLSSKNIVNNYSEINSNEQLLSEDDTLIDRQTLDMPIKLVKGK
tara:strand:- start:749 stop:1252 length:504 start_codon:yes stop_codon:yes gene_type:complete